MTAAIIAMFIAQLADIVTTRNALGRPGTYEANPVIRFLMSRFGAGWVIVKALVAVTCVVVAHQYQAEWVIWVVAGVTGFVAYRNARL